MPRLLARLAAGVISALMVVAWTTTVLAAPSEPVMHFDDLRSALATAPSHHLSGYMRTVVEGSDITTIPVTVLSVPVSGTADKSLIMFEATGSLITQYGGIVSGMSGSPIYVDDGTGTDKLIGAVSYGEEFTLGGTGLATPIDAMAKLESTYSDAPLLGGPVITSNGVKRRIIVAPNPQDYSAEAASGAFVARPLNSVYIGGLSPTSAGYQKLAKALAAKGVTPVPLSTGLAASPYEWGAGFNTTLTAGSSVAALVTRGDLWVGGIGSVTYANGDNVLAFGHPAYWSGATGLYMANAYIEGVWPSTIVPFKVGEPGAVRGTITQDRTAGILGKQGLRLAETTVTAHALNVDNCDETSSTVCIPRTLLANGFGDSTLVSMAAYVAGANLFDQRAQPGSAHATTTVTLLDGDTTRTVTMANYSSSANDIASAVSMSAQTAITTLQSVSQYGIEKPQILSIDVTGEYSARRKDAQIVSVDAPCGLRVGANRVRVNTFVFGMETTQTADATVTIPAGMPLGGTLTAAAASDVSVDAMSAGDNLWGVTFKRKTIAGLVDQLNATVPDTVVVLTYQAGGASSSSGSYDEYMGEEDSNTELNTVTAQVNAPWPISGRARSSVTAIQAMVLPNPVSYGGFVEGVVGTLVGPTSATKVSLYERLAGSATESLVATTTATPYGGVLMFELPVMRSYTRNATYRVHSEAVEGATAGDTPLSLGVRAALSLKSSARSISRGKRVKLSASAVPGTSAGGTVVFERKSGKKWARIAIKTLAASGGKGVASLSWKPSKGTQMVRVRYLGGAYNCATTSGSVRISVR
jgi:hypothetical protein